MSIHDNPFFINSNIHYHDFVAIIIIIIELRLRRVKEIRKVLDILVLMQTISLRNSFFKKLVER